MPNRTAPARTAQTIEDATAEAEEAQALVNALEERIRSGDASVAVDQLDTSRKLAEFAGLRVEAARRSAFEAGQRDAAAALKTAADRVRAIFTDSGGELDGLRQEATKAFDAYMTARETLWADAFRAARALRIANEAATSYDLPNSTDAHGVGYNAMNERFSITTDRGSVGNHHWGDLKDPKHAAEAVLGPAGLLVERGSKIASSRPAPTVR